MSSNNNTDDCSDHILALPDDMLHDCLSYTGKMGLWISGFVCKKLSYVAHEVRGRMKSTEPFMMSFRYTAAILSGNIELFKFVQQFAGDAPDSIFPRDSMQLALETSLSMSKYIRGLGFAITDDDVPYLFKNSNYDEVVAIFEWVSDEYDYAINLRDTSACRRAVSTGNLDVLKFAHSAGYKINNNIGSQLAVRSRILPWLKSTFVDTHPEMLNNILRDYALRTGDLPLLKTVCGGVSNSELKTAVKHGHLDIIKHYFNGRNTSELLFIALLDNQLHVAEYLVDDHSAEISTYEMRLLVASGNIVSLQWLHDRSLFKLDSYAPKHSHVAQWLESVGYTINYRGMLNGMLSTTYIDEFDRLFTLHKDILQDWSYDENVWYDAITSGTYTVLLKHGLKPPARVLSTGCRSIRSINDLFQHVDTGDLTNSIKKEWSMPPMLAKILFDRGIISSADVRRGLTEYSYVADYIFWSRFIDISFDEQVFMNVVAEPDLELAIYIYEHAELDHSKCIRHDPDTDTHIGVCHIFSRETIAGVKWAHSKGFKLDEATISEAVLYDYRNTLEFAAGIDDDLGKWAITLDSGNIVVTDSTSGEVVVRRLLQ